jgi:serine kinase of HPr protein (carbohydrate metabolism regulator)
MAKINGTCVSIGNAGVLIRGPSGAGKSDLALRLIDRGGTLVSDDYCEIEMKDGAIVLSPPATIAGQMEVRGLGILKTAYRERAQLELVVDLTPNGEIERLPEKTMEEISGVKVAWMQVDPHHASADAKVRMKIATLRMRGAEPPR